MLRVRPEQVAVLEEYMVRQFEARMVVHLRRVFAEELKMIGEEVLQKQIRLVVEKAAQYHITKKSDVQRYLECAVVYGWAFDTTQWAGKILQREGWDGGEKMDRIEQYELISEER
jgi:hypothetical protein